jgi:hypothetical protein
MKLQVEKSCERYDGESSERKCKTRRQQHVRLGHVDSCLGSAYCRRVARVELLHGMSAAVPPALTPVFVLVLLLCLVSSPADAIVCRATSGWLEIRGYIDQPDRWFPAIILDATVTTNVCKCLGWQTFVKQTAVSKSYDFVRVPRPSSCNGISKPPWCSGTYLQTSSSGPVSVTCGCDPAFTGNQCGACAPGYIGFPNCRPPCSNALDCNSRSLSNVTQKIDNVTNVVTCKCNCPHIFSGSNCGGCSAGFDPKKGCMGCVDRIQKWPACRTKSATITLPPTATSSRSATITPPPTRSQTRSSPPTVTYSRSTSIAGTPSDSLPETLTEEITLTREKVRRFAVPNAIGKVFGQDFFSTTVTASAAAAVAVGVLAGVPTAGAMTFRSFAILRTATCEYVDDPEPDPLQYPFVFSTAEKYATDASPTEDYATGSLSVLIVLCAIGIPLIPPLGRRISAVLPPAVSIIGALHATAAAFWIPSAFEASALVYRHSEVLVEQVVSSCGAWLSVAMLAPAVFVVVYLEKFVSWRLLIRPNSPPTSLRKLRWMARPGGYNLTRPRDDDPDAPLPSKYLMDAIGSYFVESRDPRVFAARLFVFEEIVVACIMGSISGWRPQDSCYGVAGAMVGVAVLHLAYIAQLWPQRTRLDRWFAGFMALVQLVQAILSVISLENSEAVEPLAMASVAAVLGVVFQFAVYAVLQGKKFVTRSQKLADAALSQRPPQTSGAMRDPHHQPLLAQVPRLAPVETDPKRDCDSKNSVVSGSVNGAESGDDVHGSADAGPTDHHSGSAGAPQAAYVVSNPLNVG